MVSASLDVFLTAYDPSDLPGGSIDPVGFETGYLYLAEQILPHLTNVANKPRYFSVLCAGIRLADVSDLDMPRIKTSKRLACALRMERFWAIANVLASRQSLNGGSLSSSLRGVTYAKNRVNTILERNQLQTDADFPLLSQQMRYGMVGIYGAVAERFRMLDRATLTLTPDLGERLADAFLHESRMPQQLKKAVRENGKVSVETLTDWGERSHVTAMPSTIESDCIRQAFHFHTVRSRMGHILQTHPLISDDETELSRLARIASFLKQEPDHQDLLEAIHIILAYEQCYALVLLAFERVLWLCKQLPGAFVCQEDLARDVVLGDVCARLPAAIERFRADVGSASALPDMAGLIKLQSVRVFLDAVSLACASPIALVDVLLAQHADVQSGKFDQGRRKSPWLESNDGHIKLAYAQVGGRSFELTDPRDIIPHYYRTAAADEILRAAKDK